MTVLNCLRRLAIVNDCISNDLEVGVQFGSSLLLIQDKMKGARYNEIKSSCLLEWNRKYESDGVRSRERNLENRSKCVYFHCFIISRRLS